MIECEMGNCPFSDSRGRKLQEREMTAVLDFYVRMRSRGCWEEVLL